jgi:hypothetical protein
MERIANRASEATAVAVLREGYWDRTELIRLPDGSLRVRKASQSARTGPWSLVALRREIRYLQSLSGQVAGYFPKLLAAWDEGGRAGYEMSYIDDSRDVGAIAQSGQIDQSQADLFQDALGRVIFDLVHTPARPDQALSAHVKETMFGVLAELESQERLSPLIAAGAILVNGQRLSGTRLAAQRICERAGMLSSLDDGPCVRLHGDCFLENILLPARATDQDWPQRLTLLDPVSVAGVDRGHPMFDLVKYESYATGELLALRSGKVQVEGFDRPTENCYLYRLRTDEPTIQPFVRIDWGGRFRAAYVRKYGPVNLRAYHLLEGYFALVMALCTRGLQREARLLRATIALNAAVE